MRKRVEYLGDAFLRNADTGVAHVETQRKAIALPRGIRHHSHRHMHAAFERELDCIGNDIRQHLADTHRIPQHDFRHIGGDLAGHLQFALERRCGEQLRYGGDARTNMKCGAFDFNLACLDFRQIQNIVNDFKQGFAGNLDRIHVLALLIVQQRGVQQTGHTQHTVHRRANFVAHVGEKL